jgi:hypothetical protein
MVCTTCGRTRFVSTECKMSEVSAPAFECVECHALYPDGRAVRSEAEQEAVSMAKTVRVPVVAAVRTVS